MIEISPKFVPLNELLNRRLFRIPQYQRAYSWQKKQREDLFEDIERTWRAGDDRPHFMATIVGLRTEKRTIIADEYQVIEVVDGQQRITTLILLLKAIAKLIDRSNGEWGKIGKEIDDTLVKNDGATFLLLQTNHDTSHYFDDYVKNGTYPNPSSAKTLADREILSAMEDCEKFVAEWQENNGQLKDLVILLKNRLFFIFHEIGNEALVYTVFEVLNSRGLPVSWFDRLKSMLMAIVFEYAEYDVGSKEESINRVHRLWTDIYRRVGLRQGLSAESLRFAATLRSDDRPSSIYNQENATELLRRQSNAGPSDVIETTKWLKSVTEVVDDLMADRRKNAVTRIIQARLVAVAVKLRQDISEMERDQILRHWENITFRIYGMFRKDARTAVGDYTRLAWDITRNDLSAKDILSRLSKIGESYPVDEAVDEMKGSDCYDGWQEELRYFFFRYEEYLSADYGQNFSNEQWNRIWEANSSHSVEHIRPQGANPHPWVHGLGNLLILPPRLNSKLGAKPAKSKSSEYRKTGLLVATQVADTLDGLDGWTQQAIRERENVLLEWARKEWAD